MASLTDSPLLRKEGPHRKFDDLEFWAEDGVICIIDTKNGDINAVYRKEFAHRARAINEEAKKLVLTSDRRRLNDCVMLMHEVWKEAKQQGDPSDPEVIKKRIRERRRAILVTGADW